MKNVYKYKTIIEASEITKFDMDRLGKIFVSILFLYTTVFNIFASIVSFMRMLDVKS